MFELSSEPIDIATLRQGMVRQDCGGFAAFEGWVRDFNEGCTVLRLEYEAYPELANLEAERILAAWPLTNRARQHPLQGNLLVNDAQRDLAHNLHPRRQGSYRGQYLFRKTTP